MIETFWNGMLILGVIVVFYDYVRFRFRHGSWTDHLVFVSFVILLLLVAATSGASDASDSSSYTCSAWEAERPSPCAPRVAAWRRSVRDYWRRARHAEAQLRRDCERRGWWCDEIAEMREHRECAEAILRGEGCNDGYGMPSPD